LSFKYDDSLKDTPKHVALLICIVKLYMTVHWMYT